MSKIISQSWCTLQQQGTMSCGRTVCDGRWPILSPEVRRCEDTASGDHNSGDSTSTATTDSLHAMWFRRLVYARDAIYWSQTHCCHSAYATGRSMVCCGPRAWVFPIADKVLWSCQYGPREHQKCRRNSFSARIQWGGSELMNVLAKDGSAKFNSTSGYLPGSLPMSLMMTIDIHYEGPAR